MLPSGLPDLVADGEDLARFLTQSSHFTASMPKPAAFLPSPNGRETSVSRHGPAPLESLWAIGLEAAGDRNLHGAAIFKARVVRAAQLEVAPDEPPPRHAVIRNWPWMEADPGMQKAAQKEKALLLASEAVLVLR
jgi:hypothetical protein